MNTYNYLLNQHKQPQVNQFVVLPVEMDCSIYGDTQLEIVFTGDEDGKDVRTLELFVRPEYTDTSFSHYYGVENQYYVDLDYSINSTDGFSEQFVNYIVRNIEEDLLNLVC